MKNSVPYPESPMHRTFYTLLVLALLAACQPISPPAITVTPAVTLLAPTETSIPPTETQTPAPTEIKAIINPEQMTTEVDLTNLDAMPAVNEENVSKGELRQSVLDFWKTERGGSIINPDGTINKPENVVPAKPSEWVVQTRTGDAAQKIPGGDQVLAPFTKPGTYRLMKDYALQPTDLLFKVKDDAGNITGVLITEILYYQDTNGVVKVEPVFFFINISRTSNPDLPIFFGHGSFDGPTGDGIRSTLFVGVKAGEIGQANYIARFISDKNAFLSEPMQKDREAFAQQVDASGNPEGMGNFWWAANPTSAEYKPK